MNDEGFLNELCARFNSGERFKYVFFWSHQPGKGGISAACLSQWYDASFLVEGQRYATAEQFMMAEKAALFDDENTRLKILEASTPGAAKALGRSVSEFDYEKWAENRFDIVVRANRAKFRQNPELGNFLKQTGNRILVEASPVDRIWGIGLNQDNERAVNPNLWLGLNLLGFALMQVRTEL